MPFDLQPILTGDLVTLRPLQPEDHDALYAVASDPLIWEQHPARDRYQPDVFREFFRGALESGGAFVVIDRNTDRVIGSTRFLAYDEAQSEVEIGWTFLARACWGGVYNREMKRLMLEHAFRYVENAVLLIDPQNTRSRQAAKKLGAEEIGRRANSAGRESIVYLLRRP
jgi:RimJ/RimL family protein N-acetyltransferase